MAKLLGHFMDDIPLAERRKPHGEIAFAPRLNVAETDDALELTAEMPGLTSDDVDVSLSGNLLTIKGKREAKKEEKKKDYHLVESRYGSFYRAMQLPFNVDPAKINAACKDGVLTVTVPKPVEMANKTQKITVKK
ncbi:MAG TPA: Hsp20/alpha crystallin family protein [Alphaproteobacteria bacterium]|nr:Hsp20/alpha crystallin family protein [Alphaproteobacteria bacterium]